MDDLMYLKSGTDIRGVAVEKDGKVIDLTDERLMSITASFVVFLKNKIKKDKPTVTVGYDSRVSSEHISRTVTRTLSSLGVKVYDCGLSSTPSMFMSIVNFGVDAAIEITASHLPMERVEVFYKRGRIFGE